MIQRQITDHKSNNSLALVGCTRVLSEIILKFRHLKYRTSDKLLVFMMNKKYHQIEYEIYFYNRLIQRYKYRYYFLPAQSNIRMFNFLKSEMCVYFEIDREAYVGEICVYFEMVRVACGK